MSGLGQNSKTLNVDTLFVRDIYFKDFANNPIPANQPFVSRGDGGTYFTSSFTSSIGIPAINAVTAPLEGGGVYTFAPIGTFNTFNMNPGAGIDFYSNTSNGGLDIYSIGPEQIIADGQVLPFTSLPDYTVGGRTLQYVGTGDTYLQVSDATIFFNSIMNSSISTVLYLQSTTAGLENQLNSSIAILNSLVTSTGVYNYNLISSYFFTPGVINISTVSTSLLVLGDNTIRDIPLRDSLYDPCIVYTASTALSTNTDFLTFTDNFSGVTFAIDKEYIYGASTLFYGPSTTTVTRGQQVQLGWFPTLSTQTDLMSLRAQFVPVVQQIQVLEELVDIDGLSTTTNYYMKNIGRFDEICNPSKILLTAPIIAATVRRDESLTSGFLHYNSTTMEIVYNNGGSTIACGEGAGELNQGIYGIAIGYNAGQNNQSPNTIVLNATGATLEGPTASAFYVAPIRNDNTGYGNILSYNTGTSEIIYDTTKTFVINHPKDESKYLVHACLEGPEAGVYYRGTGTIADLESSVTVHLPDYVDALATDFTVQVTPIFNGAVRILNASCISNNRFTVYGDSGDFFWHVYGRRAAVVVEPKKSEVTVLGEGPYRWIA